MQTEVSWHINYYEYLTVITDKLLNQSMPVIKVRAGE